MRTKLFFFLALITAVLIGAFVMVVISQRTGVTKQNFEKIKVGMHRDEVNVILDTEDFSDDVSGKRFEWCGSSGICSVQFDEKMCVSECEWIARSRTTMEMLQDTVLIRRKRTVGPYAVRNF